MTGRSKEAKKLAQYSARYDGTELGDIRKKYDPWVDSTTGNRSHEIDGYDMKNRRKMRPTDLKKMWGDRLKAVGLPSSGTAETVIRRAEAFSEWMTDYAAPSWRESKLTPERAAEMAKLFLRTGTNARKAITGEGMSGMVSQSAVQQLNAAMLESRPDLRQWQETLDEEIPALDTPASEVIMPEEMETPSGEVVEVEQTAEERVDELHGQLMMMDSLLKCQD